MGSSVDSKTAQRLKGQDFDFTGLSDNDVLVYDEGTGTWKPEAPSFEYEVTFVEVEQVLQLFRNDSSITSINLANVDVLSYDKNETGSFTTLTLPGDLPLAVSAGDTITWQIAYSAGKDKASINIIGTTV